MSSNDHDRAAAAGDDYDIVIEQGARIGRYWRDLWAHRGLLFYLAWRDILVRYKQTVVGSMWCILQPLITMVVFTVIFGRLARLPTEAEAPYPVMVFAALLPWQMFASALGRGSSSIVVNTNLVSKVYFPRVIVPASAAVVSIVDFLVSFGLLLCLMAWYRFVPGWRFVALPFFVLLAMLPAIGFGVWLAALNVKYRDFAFIVPYLIQFGMFLSPVGYSSGIVPEHWKLLYSINPMVGVIDGFRWAILGGKVELYLPGLALSIVFSLLIFAFGLAYFRRTERTFADVI